MSGRCIPLQKRKVLKISYSIILFSFFLFQLRVITKNGCFAEFMERPKILNDEIEVNMRMKTMEAFLLLEADTEAKLKSENRNPLQFLLLLGNMVSCCFL